MSSTENRTTIPQIPPIYPETPGEKTLKWWYQAKLAERLMQAVGMEKNKELLRRGARKMQDGTLGQAGEPEREEPVNISIGDTYQLSPSQPANVQPANVQPANVQPANVQPANVQPNTSVVNPADSAPVTPSTGLSKTAIAGILAAVLASGGLGTGISWLAGAFDKAPLPVVAPVIPNTTINQLDNQWRELQFGKARPTKQTKPTE